MVQRLRVTRGFSWCFAGAALLLVSIPAFAQETFDTPEEAVTALVVAAKDGDKTELLEILGPGSEEIVSSGDDVADRNARETFASAYDEKHSLEREGGDRTVLVLGSDNWPFPIPIIEREGRWEFDAPAGHEEILLRRIGRNELSAIQASLAYVAAQREYATLDVDGVRPPAYAQRIISSEGKKDGLYWPSAAGETQSPLGALFAEASDEGYELGGAPVPYHGYHYRVLTSQGPGADGGAFDYVVDGRMIGGFALLAYPAEYGNSGIMTFIVNHDGVVFQSDLGPDTEARAAEIDDFAPGETWTEVEAR